MIRKVVAENYLCFLALLEMIIESEQKIKITQYDMAEEFGVTIPIGCKININNISYSNIEREYGVHLNEEKLNIFFAKNGINIHATYFHINPFEELEIDEFDKGKLRERKHIIYTFSYGDLFCESENLDIGHVALLWEVVSEDELLIYDPGPRDAGLKKIKRHNMYDAMRCRHSGVYVLERNKN